MPPARTVATAEVASVAMRVRVRRDAEPMWGSSIAGRGEQARVDLGLVFVYVDARGEQATLLERFGERGFVDHGSARVLTRTAVGS